MAIKRGLLLGILLLATTAGAVLATHNAVGLTTLAAYRGTMDRADLAMLVRELGPMHKLESADLLVVRASVAPGGTTAWHGHTGPSIVTVTEGSVEVTTWTPSGCTVATYTRGQAFYHSEHAHTFVNRGATTAEFVVAYLIPAGGAVTHPPEPAC